MVNRGLMAQQKQRYLELLSEKYPTKESVYSRLINLQARLVMPKGVEHFVSDHYCRRLNCSIHFFHYAFRQRPSWRV